MLTAQENFQLVKLLDKLEWPVTPEVFDALCVNFVTSPIELAVIRRGEKEQGSSDDLSRRISSSTAGTFPECYIAWAYD